MLSQLQTTLIWRENFVTKPFANWFAGNGSLKMLSQLLTTLIWRENFEKTRSRTDSAETEVKSPHRILLQKGLQNFVLSTGKSLSEALISASTNPQYYHSITSSIHENSKLKSGENMLCTLTFKTIFVHNMFSPCSGKRRASDKDVPVPDLKSKMTNNISWIL